MKKINDQKQLTRSEIQSAILYACLCTYDELEKREMSLEEKELFIDIFISGLFDGKFSGYGANTVNGNIIISSGGARNVMFDVGKFREIYGIESSTNNMSMYEVFRSNSIKDEDLRDEVIRSFKNICLKRDSIKINLESLNSAFLAIMAYRLFYKNNISLNFFPDSSFIKDEWIREKSEDDFILDTCSHIGATHEVNQDYSIVCSHPSLEGVELMVVADGVSQSKHGEDASRMFCDEMKKWFCSLNERDFEGYFSRNLKRAIRNADKKIGFENDLKDENNVTVGSVVVITPNDTYISTVGDTRVYLEADGSLEAIKRIECMYDKMLSLGAYQDGSRKDDGLDKYRPEGYIGYGLDNVGLCNPEVVCINSSDYTGILAVTDGVYDRISENDLDILFTRCNPYDISKIIVERAAEGYVSNPRYNELISNSKKRGGDDMTVAVYKKNRQYEKIKEYKRY